MPVLTIILFFTSPDFVRVPVKSAPPEIRTSRVWVFFTDKGIYNRAQYQAALDALKRTAPPAPPRRREFDFDDLPVRQDYIRAIEARGARLRTISRWLNAASFELAPELVPEIYNLPFVYDIKPVAFRTETDFDLTVPIKQPAPVSRTRALDTASAHRFYGAAYDQAQMLGVPEIFFRGYFGSGVKLALFDTGLKLKNQAVKNLRIYRQYDFLAGDNFYIWHTGSEPALIPQLRFLGLVKSPALATAGNLGLLTFVADSFNYYSGLPARAIFFSHSSDRGSTWTAPGAIVISRPYYYTYENLQFLNRDSVFYLAFNEVDLHPGGMPTCYLGYFINTGWQNRQTIGTGKQPCLAIYADTLYLAYLKTDSIIALRKAEINQSAPNWLLYTELRFDQPMAEPQLIAGPQGRLNLLSREINSGRIVHLTSTDGGNSFNPLPEIVSQKACQLKVFLLPGADSIRLLIYQEHTEPALTRLVLVRSTDFGTTWHGRVTIDSGLVFGTSTLSFADNQLNLFYEAAGIIQHLQSSNLGETWNRIAMVDSAGFGTAPLAAPDNSFLLWFRRGDEVALWEDDDTLKFSFDQPNHGTRMASIIAGYQPYSMMGIAPGVDLIVARTEYYKTAGNRGYEYNLEEDTYIQALEWAERCGADIVSTSLGYRGWYRDEQFDGRTAPVSIAANLAAKRGMLIVTAMGNRDTTEYPWPRPYITAPGDAEGVITCGGVQKNLTPWRGTGTGPTADGRIKPDLVALADTVAVAAPDSVNFLEGSVGTSCATALIAGCLALLKEAHPEWSADSLKAVLYATASRAVKSCTFGFGVPRIDSAFKRYPPSNQAPPIEHDRITAIYPNPFITRDQPKVYFPIELTRVTPVAEITIYTTSGTRIKTIPLNAAKMTTPGRYLKQELLEQIGACWDGRNESGKPAGSGLYLAVLQTTFGKSIARFALIR
ncbi:MAG: S8 family serine peptidase [candidate division WOR-3 bacterium]